jgi:hypothetical protein
MEPNVAAEAEMEAEKIIRSSLAKITLDGRIEAVN